MVAEEAERYEVDVALSMMPWNYTQIHIPSLN